MISTTNSICHDVQATLEHHSSSIVALFWCVWGVERDTPDKKTKGKLVYWQCERTQSPIFSGLFAFQKTPHHANLGAKFA